MRAAALTLAILLAGCLSAGSPDAGEVASDAWSGATALTLVEEELAVSALLHAGGDDRCLAACPSALVTPGARLVPHDTARVEIVAEWTGAPARLRLRYDHGASADLVQEALAPGEPHIIQLAPGMADSPGQRHSHWWFSFAVPDEAGSTPETPVRVNIVAHRADQPVARPPARDVWSEGTPNVLVQPLARSNAFVLGPGVGRCVDCDGTWWSSAPGGIVAPDATRVRVSVEWTGDTPLVAGAFVPPDTFVDFELAEETGNGRVYEAAVDPSLADSPDQTKSLWWFFVEPERDAGLVDGEFTLVAEAVR